MVPATWDYLAETVPQLEQVSERFGNEVKQQISPVEQTGAREKE